MPASFFWTSSACPPPLASRPLTLTGARLGRTTPLQPRHTTPTHAIRQLQPLARYVVRGKKLRQSRCGPLRGHPPLTEIPGPFPELHAGTCFLPRKKDPGRESCASTG